MKDRDDEVGPCYGTIKGCSIDYVQKSTSGIDADRASRLALVYQKI